MLKEYEEEIQTGADAAGPQPFILDSGGEPLYATYHPPAAEYRPPSGEPRRGHRVAVLVLEQLGPHRMNLRLTRALAAAGYPVLAFDFRGRGESGGPYDTGGQRHLVPPAMIEDTLVALTELRRRADPERVVLFGACQAGHVAAQTSQYGGVDGLILAGMVNFDEHFRANYRGVLPGLPRLADLPTVDLFEALATFHGPLLLVHGSADPYMAPQRLLELAEEWAQAAEDRQLEIRIIDGSDHTFSSRSREQVVIREAVTWLERRYGPGYPQAWQGPPPSLELVAPQRDDGVAAQVPLLATGARLVSVTDVASAADRPAWRLELPDGRHFALTDSLRQLVALVDGHRSVAAIAEQLRAAIGRPISAEQVARLLRERLAPLGVVEPDARGEGGEAESGMTDILIRCYQPHDRLRALLDNLTRVTRSPYNVILVVGKRHAARNQNIALDRSLTRYAVFLDDDVLLTEGWLERLRETMDRTGAGAVSGRQLGMHGQALYSSAGCPEGAVVEAPIGGTCFMFRTDLGLRFDESYVRSQWDDVDFMFELYERGYKTYIDGRVPFYHYAEGKIWLNQNFFYFQQKWLERGRLRGWYRYRYANGHIVTLLPSYGAAGGAPSVNQRG